MKIYKQFKCKEKGKFVWRTHILIREEVSQQLIWSWLDCDIEDGYDKPIKNILISQKITESHSHKSPYLYITYEDDPL